ncbi:MAG: hypothetical protein ACLSTN_00245 [Coprococcus sp.]
MKHEALEKFINSFKPMPLTKAFFLKIYGYELTWSGSAERCLQRLEELGSSRARKLYAAVVADYEEKQEKTAQEVAAWYAEQLERKYSNKEVRAWSQKETERLREDLQEKSDEELLILLSTMK